MTTPIIITVAMTGAIPRKKDCPGLPDRLSSRGSDPILLNGDGDLLSAAGIKTLVSNIYLDFFVQSEFHKFESLNKS
jgi:hypothetical protein